MTNEEREYQVANRMRQAMAFSVRVALRDVSAVESEAVRVAASQAADAELQSMIAGAQEVLALLRDHFRQVPEQVGPVVRYAAELGLQMEALNRALLAETAATKAWMLAQARDRQDGAAIH